MILWKRPLHKILPPHIQERLQAAVEVEFGEPMVIQYEQNRLRKCVTVHGSDLDPSKVSRWLLKWTRKNWTVKCGENPYAESRRLGFI